MIAQETRQDREEGIRKEDHRMGPDANRRNGMRYYILSPEYALRGWKRLPYAIQSAPRAT